MSYYILQNDETKGPYTLGQLRSMWSSGSITTKTMHCQEGDSEWRPLSGIVRELEPPATPPAAAPPQPSMVVVKPTKSRGTYIILGLFFGLLCIHDFYAGRYRRGTEILLCTVLFGWILIGLIISVIVVIVELCNVTQDGDGQKMT
jgi:TM2 domain-containing membrane protein YozV